MAPIERSAVANATPGTIWETCFANMNWEKWDVDVKEVLEATTCEEGKTFTFLMKANDMKVPCVLSDVTKNEGLTFTGSMGPVKCVGIVGLTPEGDGKTKIDYSFELTGCIGSVLTKFNSKAVVGGTEVGLENMVSLSEEAQSKK